MSKAPRVPGGEAPPPETGPLVVRNRVGIDVGLELQHLERNLALTAAQGAAVRRRLEAVDRLLRRHVEERRRQRDRTLVLHRALERLGRAFEKVLARHAREEAAARRAIRTHLAGPQRRQFDRLMAERARFEAQWAKAKSRRDKALPPSKRPV